MTAADKILPEAALRDVLDAHRRSGRRIVLSNGGFDLLHVGHIRYLRGAAAEADRLFSILMGDAVDNIPGVPGVGEKTAKAMISLWMQGGPSHLDLFDLKPDAPAEIRGEFQPINTNVPGIQICEHMPRLAAVMDKCVPLRSVYGSPSGAHDSFICYTGRSTRNQPTGGWPSIGSDRITKPSAPAHKTSQASSETSPAASPSTVLMAPSPTYSTGMSHEWRATPSIRTVQVPQVPSPHPNRVPLSPSSFLST